MRSSLRCPASNTGTWVGTSQRLGRRERTHAAHQGSTGLRRRHLRSLYAWQHAPNRTPQLLPFLSTPLASLPNEKHFHSHHPPTALSLPICAVLLNGSCTVLDSTGAAIFVFGGYCRLSCEQSLSKPSIVLALRSSPSKA